MDDERLIIFLERDYAAFSKTLREMMRSGFNIILYLTGYAMERRGFEAHSRMLGKGEGNPEQLIRLGEIFFQQLGYDVLKMEASI